MPDSVPNESAVTFNARCLAREMDNNLVSEWILEGLLSMTSMKGISTIYVKQLK